MIVVESYHLSRFHVRFRIACLAPYHIIQHGFKTADAAWDEVDRLRRGEQL